MKEDLTGQTFGRLFVIGETTPTGSGNRRWLCQCKCGNTTTPTSYNLKTGKTVSCGRCTASERATARNYKHGGFGSRLYEIWRQMHRRCNCPTMKHYKDYGGRGISICEEWDDYAIFEEWALSHGYEETLTIDRIDVNGNYEPNNCRWATVKQQANNRRNNHLVEYEGTVHTVSEWADLLCIEQRKLYSRLARNDWNLALCIGA